MKNSQSRMEDMGNNMLVITQQDDGTIEISTDPKDSVVTFTRSGGGSENTRNALIDLFWAMKQDQKEYPQEKVTNGRMSVSRREDGNSIHKEMHLEYYGDVKLYMPFNLDHYEFKTAKNWWQSANTQEALVKVLAAMQIDNEERPQDKRIAEREPEDPERVERLRKIIEKSKNISL